MKNNYITCIVPEIIIPVERAILRIPVDSPLIELINKNDLEEINFHWQELAHSEKVIIFLKSTLSLNKIIQELLNRGKDTMTTVFISGYDENNDKRMLTGKLINIIHMAESMSFVSLETIIIGNLQFLKENKHFKEKPLWGKKIITTRPTLQAYELVRRLENLGADVLEFPLIDLKLSVNYDHIMKVLEEIEIYQWIVFDMNFRVDYFIAYLLGSGYQLDRLKNIKICALSLEVAERLNEFGLEVHYFSSCFFLDGEKAINGFKKSGINSEQPILIIASQERGTILLEKLKELQVDISLIPMIKAQSIEMNQKKLDQIKNFFPADMWVFNTPIGLRELRGTWQQINENLQSSTVVAMGVKTHQALEEVGISADIMPKEVTIPSLIETIVSYYDNKAMNGNE